MLRKIARYKLLIMFFILYLPILGVILYFYSGSPPDLDVKMYKGTPIGTSLEWSHVDLYAREDGLNIVRTTMFWFIDKNGNLHEIPGIKALMIAHIQHAHRLGLKIYVSIRPQYGLGEPKKIPEDIRPIALEQLKQKVIEWAGICEKWGVELYAPIQECEILTDFKWDDENSATARLVGDQDITEWIQHVLPEIKERYSGEVVCGGGAWGGATSYAWKEILDECEVDFTGYDYITFGPYSWHLKYLDDVTVEAYREYISYSLAKLNEWAERDGCKGVIIREMGGPREYYEVVFEEGEDTLKGIITTHWHWDREFVRYWFKERLP